jgi:hypothetical protein
MAAALEFGLPRLQAEEGGAGDYIHGLYASLINITPNKPGFAIGSGYLYYTGSGDRGSAGKSPNGCLRPIQATA